MGTKFTVHHNFYQTRLPPDNMELVVPTPNEQLRIHNKLVSEIGLGIVEEATRRELLRIVERMRKENQIDGLILGCTELPSVLERDEFGIPFLNTTAIHIESIVRRCTGPSPSEATP
jgi:aspartate racemase